MFNAQIHYIQKLGGACQRNNSPLPVPACDLHCQTGNLQTAVELNYQSLHAGRHPQTILFTSSTNIQQEV